MKIENIVVKSIVLLPRRGERCIQSAPHSEQVSVIIPTTRRTVVRVLEIIKGYVELSGREVEVIIVRGAKPAARARNIGAHKARGDLLVFIDDDIIIDVASFSKFVNKLLDADGKAIVGNVACHTFFKFPYIPANLVGLKRDSFMEIGEFDERIYGYEELDFSMRAVEKGYKLLNAQANLKHYNPQSLRNFLLRSFRYEIHGSFMAIKYAQYFRLNNLRWFFPFFIDTSKESSLFKGGIYTLVRSPVSRGLTRILGFYYWFIKMYMSTLKQKVIRRHVPSR
jgi:glycosyltransferase involved in cell wall biosynthesis